MRVPSANAGGATKTLGERLWFYLNDDFRFDRAVAAE